MEEQLATISILEDTVLEGRIKNAYEKDELSKRQLEKQTGGFTLDEQGILRFKSLVYIPAHMRRQFIREQHSLPAHGHQGITKTFQRITQDYYFPGIRKLIEEEVLNVTTHDYKVYRFTALGRESFIAVERGLNLVI